MKYARFTKNICAPAIGLGVAWFFNELIVTFIGIPEKEDLNVPGIVLMIENMLPIILFTILCIIQIFIVEPRTRVSVRKIFSVSILFCCLLGLLCSLLSIYIDKADLYVGASTFLAFFIPLAVYISSNLWFVYWINYLNQSGSNRT
ncbi:MAG: hypothetical protein EOP54_11625 [Sphingobacteriales bacterium]|nr:MAG: hypothetical protein EOP54_11625 [Sphingobacteriales bacterium]